MKYIIDALVLILLLTLLFFSCKKEVISNNYSRDVDLIYKTIQESGVDIYLSKEEIENQIKKSKKVEKVTFLDLENEDHVCATYHERDEDTPSYRQDLPIPDEIIIPVVFHVMHSNGTGNISTEQILSGLDRLNNDFSESNFTFCLATKDPDGNPSSGIIRINVNETYPDYQSVYNIAANNSCINSINSVSYLDIYELSMWPKSHAVNVYIFPQINCGNPVRGYYTGNINSSTSDESIGVRFDAIGLVPEIVNGQTFSYNTTAGGVFTHEVGHYFNLRHIWGQTLRPDLDCGNVTENPFSCGGGGVFDFVCDTPPTSGPRNNNCSQGFSCPNALVGNYMDYDITCYNHFTPGQIQRMHESIFTPGRTALINSNGAACSSLSCLWDLNQDNIVNIQDLMIMLSEWGNPWNVSDLMNLLANIGCEN
jgi:hypothetical protein